MNEKMLRPHAPQLPPASKAMPEEKDRSKTKREREKRTARLSMDRRTHGLNSVTTHAQRRTDCQTEIDRIQLDRKASRRADFTGTNKQTK